MSYRRLLLVNLLMLALATATGCTRHFFRERTDREVEDLLTEKNCFEPWRIENWHVYPDSRSRFADPSDPDHPPKPPDDPATRCLAPDVQRAGKAGVGLYEGTGYLDLLAAWDAMNRAEQAPALPPVGEGGPQDQIAEPEPLPSEDRGYLLKFEQVCELGLINSREYQDARETLYLSALPVSLQRFSFAAQFLALGDAIYETSGKKTLAGEGTRWRGDGEVGLSKKFPTGALLVYKLANDFVFNLGSGKPQISVSSMTLDLTQPLLRNGGLAVTLEPLTLAERNLVYNIRNYARFRKQFFASIAGASPGQQATAAAAVSVDLSTGATVGATGLTGNRGYVPGIRLLANVKVERQNIRTLQDFVKRMEAYAEGGQVSQLQVDTTKQSLLSSQSNLLTTEQNYRTAMDTLKLQLGLPVTVGLELDSSLLRPVTDHLARFDQVGRQYRDIQELLEEASLHLRAAPNVPRVAGKFDADPAKIRGELKKLFTESGLVKNTRFREQILNAWAAWERLTNQQLVQRMQQLRERRRVLLGEKAKLDAAEKPVPQQLTDDIAAVEADLELATLEDLLRRYEQQSWKQPGQPSQTSQFGKITNITGLILTAARIERFDLLSKTWPPLPSSCVEGVDLVNAPLDVAYQKASEVALADRLDLMNARAQLVDSWRQIAVRANSLLGVFDVGYHLNAATPAGLAKPFDFSADGTTQQLSLHGELPLVRRFERNNYRTALINYQRQRRLLQSTEDTTLAGLRSDLRLLRNSAENYRIQQEQVALAYSSVESALESFNQPPDVVGAGGPVITTGSAANAAALTNQLLGAQASVLRAQEAIFSFWIGYLTQRMTVYLDIERMPLDDRGVWIDDHATQECPAPSPAEKPAPAVRPATRLPAPPPAEEFRPSTADSGEINWRARIVSPAPPQR